MADAWQDQWVPVYSQSSNGTHEGHLPPIPSTPHTPHIRHSSSTGNLHAQATPFFGTPADLRSTQYVAYQPYLHPTPLIQRQRDTTSMLPETPSREPVNKAEPVKRSYRGRWSVETKLAHILDAINETNWSLADFLYFTFRVKTVSITWPFATVAERAHVTTLAGQRARTCSICRRVTRKLKPQWYSK